MDVPELVKTLPEGPGVYLMKDAEGQVIYVGKGASLKKRVSSYFFRGQHSPKQKIMIGKICNIDWVTTVSEAEALIIEAGLIKEYKPRYNVAIKDDTAYPLLKLTLFERFPRLLVVRRKKCDGSAYFGPYTCAKLLRQALIFLRGVFPLRLCKHMPAGACLYYALKKCKAPCAGKIQEKEYAEIVRNLHLFLEGRKEELIRRLSRKMDRAAEKQDYEQAAKWRDQIVGLGLICQKGWATKPKTALEELKSFLRLKRQPRLIEGYDVSNIQGKNAVGAMVRFRYGHKDRSAYRRFKIRTVEGVDDYAMINEIVKRRFTGSLENQLENPDLILIDGGRGHLRHIIRQLRRIKENIPVVSIAKRFEHIFVWWQKDPVAFSKNSAALRLLLQVRDEAHRFALTYHRILRKHALSSGVRRTNKCRV
ncbi:MAG: excinuclease ABC subunit UvrC [Candidatus Omnitrophica bacterium]|nr:excinuclease ABC subunit UvrC [Candidatus Omnitrophota bacterium]MBU1925700.1 excinuclease ABC subunit UvrC [Candidatus Omnitrophota bacterium]